jgi:RNA polymerase sigma factor (sigma-70 family)
MTYSCWRRCYVIITRETLQRLLHEVYEEKRKLLLMLAGQRFGLKREEAEDLVSLVHSKLYAKMRRLKYHPGISPKGALWRMLKKALFFWGRKQRVDQKRQRALHDEYAEELVQDLEYTNERQAYLAELRTDVHKALRQLPELDARIAWRIFAEEAEYKEVAEELGLSERTIYRKLPRIRAQLRGLLADYSPEARTRGQDGRYGVRRDSSARGV